jgi:hypothetical protein
MAVYKSTRDGVLIGRPYSDISVTTGHHEDLYIAPLVRPTVLFSQKLGAKIIFTMIASNNAFV